MEPSPTLLRQFSLLAPLDEQRLGALCGHFQHQRVARNAEIIRSGETSTSLYFVVDGRLKVVTYTRSGREVGLAWLGSGDWFGEMALVDEQPRSATVVTVTESVLLALPAAAAREQLLREPAVVQLLLRNLAQMVRRDNEKRALLSTGNAFQRVCGFLLSLAPYADEPYGDKLGRWQVEPALTQEAMASMTDTTRETVSRTIRLLRERGVAERQGQTLTIIDTEGLKRLAHGGTPVEE